MPKKVRKLYEKCWVCDGTRKTIRAFSGGRSDLPVGSDCPFCEGGYFETGLTIGQVDSLVEQRMKQLEGGQRPVRKKE